MSKVNPIPKEYGSITPYLVIPGCAKAIDAYKSVLGAEELMRMPMPDGTVAHAEIKLGDSIVMIADGGPAHPPTQTLIAYYVNDCDAVFAKAEKAGWETIEPLEDKFYGDRACCVRDPFGQRWSIMTHKEDVSPEEMEARMKAMSKG
jgi:PhnB protein